MPSKRSELRICDTATAAYLLTANKCRLHRIEFDPQGRGFFVFSPAPAKGAVEEYINGAEAPAVRLFQTLRTLQTRIRQERQGELGAVS